VITSPNAANTTFHATASISAPATPRSAPAVYAFNWNREKFADPSGIMARLKAAGKQPVTNLKPCLLDDHPRPDEVRAADVLVRDTATVVRHVGDGAPLRVAAGAGPVHLEIG
jgi:alpha-glucosidase (family GH31 glycosyl hydrolase)